MAQRRGTGTKTQLRQLQLRGTHNWRVRARATTSVCGERNRHRIGKGKGKRVRAQTKVQCAAPTVLLGGGHVFHGALDVVERLEHLRAARILRRHAGASRYSEQTHNHTVFTTRFNAPSSHMHHNWIRICTCTNITTAYGINVFV